MAINIDSYSVVYPQFQDISSTRTIEKQDNNAVYQLLSLYLNTDILDQEQKHSKRRNSSSLYWQSNMLNQTNWLGEYRSKSVLEKNTRMNSRPIYSETASSPRAPAKKHHKKSVSFNETVMVISLEESTLEKSTLKQDGKSNDEDDEEEDIFVDAVEHL
ncbi:hypothetical protein K501DRAFT_288697 [Backusella circina FSU 941]|nr:hypothetical protein K501DRAFT_288697 [Backusella circina FSU 941]